MGVLWLWLAFPCLAGKILELGHQPSALGGLKGMG